MPGRGLPLEDGRGTNEEAYFLADSLDLQLRRYGHNRHRQQSRHGVQRGRNGVVMQSNANRAIAGTAGHPRVRMGVRGFQSTENQHQ